METKPKVLICHHLEPMWDKSLREMGTSFYKLEKKTAQHIKKNNYSQVILTRFEEHTYNYEEYPNMYSLITFLAVYGYADCIDSCFDDNEDKDLIEDRLDEGEIVANDCGIKYALGGFHSEIVEIPKWLENLKHSDVYLCGAFDGECIDDIQTAMEAIDLKYNRISKLIV